MYKKEPKKTIEEFHENKKRLNVTITPYLKKYAKKTFPKHSFSSIIEFSLEHTFIGEWYKRIEKGVCKYCEGKNPYHAYDDLCEECFSKEMIEQYKLNPKELQEILNKYKKEIKEEEEKRKE